DAPAPAAAAPAPAPVAATAAAPAPDGATTPPPRFDAAALARDAADHATIVIPLVLALREAVGADDAPFVHLGATSQDVLDSAAMLIARDALAATLADAAAARDAAAALARAHRATPMIGRTLLQQALPTSFGLRAAGWAVAIDRAVARLRAVREQELWAQLGGPVGREDPAVAAALAADLGLAAPPLCWHTLRLPVAAVAGATATLAGILGKLARDVTLLAQNELGELREGTPGRGGSSAMAHKRNPVAAVSVLACTRRVPGLATTLLAAMEQEHERAAGAWQAEWATLTDLLALTGSAAAWSRDLLENLEVDAARMAANLPVKDEAAVAAAAAATDAALATLTTAR
ncbi:lyase family protein, partial [Conexibacter sp. JD483]|uniref:lyase family protein n=2 Tax=Conexibacter TaxID=191494 RepID=UPI00286FE76D